MYWSSSPEDHQLFLDVFKAFEDKNPGLKVEFDDVPSDDFQQTALTRIVGGTPPDAMELHPAWVPHHSVFPTNTTTLRTSAFWKPLASAVRS